MAQKLKQLIEDVEFDLEKYNFVLSMFPDATAFVNGLRNQAYAFKSPLANKLYTKWSIKTNGAFYEELFINLWYELPFESDGIKETLKIFTIPFKINLARLVIKGKKMKKELRVTNYQKLFKSNHIHGLCLRDCQSKVIDFIKKHPDHKLDLGSADKKIRDLLLFM